MESQDVLAGNIYKSINAATRIAEGLPELNWLVENRIPKTDLTIIGGKPKVGKTRLSIGLARCLLMGEEFLDDDFNEIDARLTAGWYVHSGQRKRYLKSLNQKKK